MKKLFTVVLCVSFLVGCSFVNSELEGIEEHLEIVNQHAGSAAKDKEKYVEDLEEFNKYLKNVSEEYQEYATIQMKANEMRIEGLKNTDYDLISDSSWKQAQATQILDTIKAPN